MGKPYARKFREFRTLFETLRGELGKEIYLVPYLMTGHPGCDLRDAIDLALFASELGHFAEQVQDFTPTPMTRSTCQYWTGRDPVTEEEVFVPKGWEKQLQRALAQYRDPRNRDFVVRSLERAGRTEALRTLYGGRYQRLDAHRPEISHRRPERSASPRKQGPRGKKSAPPKS